MHIWLRSIPRRISKSSRHAAAVKMRSDPLACCVGARDQAKGACRMRPYVSAFLVLMLPVVAAAADYSEFHVVRGFSNPIIGAGVTSIVPDNR